MQDSSNKCGRLPSHPSHLRVVGYDEVPLDSADRWSQFPALETTVNAVPPSQGSVRTGNTIPWINLKDDEAGKRPTLPYSPHMPDARTTGTSSPAVSGIRMGKLDPAEVQETSDNAARMSDELTRVFRPCNHVNVPAQSLHLPKHFGDLEVDKWGDQYPDPSGPGAGCDPISQRIAQKVQPVVESGDSPAAILEIYCDGPEIVLPPTPKPLPQTSKLAGRPAIAPTSITRALRKITNPATPINREKASAQLRVVSLPVQPLAPSNLPPSIRSQRITAPKIFAGPQAKLQPTTVITMPRKAQTPVQAPIKKMAEKPVEKPVEAPQEKPKSLWGRMTGKVGDKLSAVKKAVTGFLKKHHTGVVVAASLAAGTGAGVYANQNRSTEASDNANNSYQTVETPPTPTTSATEKKAPVESPEVIVTPVPIQDQLEKNPAPQRKFAKVLEDSKIPLVQDIIKNGKTKLNGSILGNTMLIPFKGLANNAQQAELNQLQRSINLGMGVYFNEHFGTAEKTAESLKDPNLRSLYSTAKVMKEKGWAPASLTKEKYPAEYQLAVQIFADSSTLDLDKTPNPDPKVQARVNGNMFQAKLNGDTLQLQKADGSYHVILEAVFNILDGQNSHQAILAAKTTNTLQPATVPVKMENSNDAGQNAPQDSISQPPTAPSHTLNQLIPATPAILQNNYTVKPQNTLAASSVEMDELDSEWEEIGKAIDQLATEKAAFEKNLSLAVEVKAGLSSRDMHRELIPAVGEKLARLYPSANAEQVVGMVKRFGFIGLKVEKADPASGQCQVRVYQNVHKILKEVLDKREVKADV